MELRPAKATLFVGCLRPNNWYVSQDKLNRVLAVWKSRRQAELPPVLVTRIDDAWSLIDGHSRALAAHMNGAAAIQVQIQPLEAIEGDASLYEHIHRAGPGHGVCHVADLAERVVSRETHAQLWIAYCQRWLRDHNASAWDEPSASA